jgi:hypothetical protein
MSLGSTPSCSRADGIEQPNRSCIGRFTLCLAALVVAASFTLLQGGGGSIPTDPPPITPVPCNPEEGRGDEECDDGDPCTDDECGYDGFCHHYDRPEFAECDDGDDCTLDDICIGGGLHRLAEGL